jgi:hypothetical protein
VLVGGDYGRPSGHKRFIRYAGNGQAVLLYRGPTAPFGNYHCLHETDAEGWQDLYGLNLHLTVAPIVPPIPRETPMLRIVGQLMLLNEIDSKNGGLIQSFDDIEVMYYFFVANLNFESEFPSALQSLS